MGMGGVLEGWGWVVDGRWVVLRHVLLCCLYLCFVQGCHIGAVLVPFCGGTGHFLAATHVLRQLRCFCNF